MPIIYRSVIVVTKPNPHPVDLDIEFRAFELVGPSVEQRRADYRALVDGYIRKLCLAPPPRNWFILGRVSD